MGYNVEKPLAPYIGRVQRCTFPGRDLRPGTCRIGSREILAPQCLTSRLHKRTSLLFWPFRPESTE